MRITLLGPPGAGKGTQAALLSKTKHIPHISTGEILRDAVAKGTELGREAKKFIDAGNLVPDALMIDLIGDRLKHADCGPGFLLDGFPRTVEQAKALTELLKGLKKDLTHVLEIVVPESVVMDRIKGRAQAAGRSDDTDEVARTRLEVYRRQTAPVKGYYEKIGKVIPVDGIGSVEEVGARLAKAVTGHGK